MRLHELIEFLLVGVSEVIQDLFLPGQTSIMNGGPLAAASSNEENTSP